MNGSDLPDLLVNRNINEDIIKSLLVSGWIVILKNDVVVDTCNNLENL